MLFATQQQQYRAPSKKLIIAWSRQAALLTAACKSCLPDTLTCGTHAVHTCGTRSTMSSFRIFLTNTEPPFLKVLALPDQWYHESTHGATTTDADRRKYCHTQQQNSSIPHSTKKTKNKKTTGAAVRFDTFCADGWMDGCRRAANIVPDYTNW